MLHWDANSDDYLVARNEVKNQNTNAFYWKAAYPQVHGLKEAYTYALY
jgi:hypothetical protein